MESPRDEIKTLFARTTWQLEVNTIQHPLKKIPHINDDTQNVNGGNSSYDDDDDDNSDKNSDNDGDDDDA